ncbi:hypothetical protein [Pedobacter hiemivivus]|uniref:Uncharacterized protein n=1 Tax=Pedobacter hiemivivus TaxID=2530454 RepID=A0A4R0NGX8_9SPHI|nr:hypothetical protein [Pedobacter hiemivivus]TCC99438.1 hypothetical protein EZ444_01815 [Pedobacter hiemivivus]
MKNSNSIAYSGAMIKKMGYIAICGVIMGIIVSGKRIALSGELKSLKMLIDPIHVDLVEDLDLLRILDEPHVKFASELADYIQFEVLNPYGLVNSLDDDVVLEDEWATEKGWELHWRFMFYLLRPKVRDRYVNFNRILLTSQRVIYELLKLMVTGETRMSDPTYRTNYSPGRLKALMIGNEDPNVVMMAELINHIKDYEVKSRAITEIPKKRTRR